MDLNRTEEIAAIFPFDEERVLISESGIWETEDARLLRSTEQVQYLVGESLMRSGDVASSYSVLASRITRWHSLDDKSKDLWINGKRTCQSSG